MKKIFTILLLVPALTFGQEVIEAPGSASELKSKALTWAANNFNNLKEAVRSETDEHLILRGNFDQMMGIGLTQVWFTLKIEFKDGRYRYQLYDTYFQQGDGRTFNLDRANKKYQAKAYKKLSSLEQSLIEHMSNPVEEW
jgi:hypothetical protein